MRLARAVTAATTLTLAALLGGCTNLSDRPETTAGQGEVILAVRPAANVDAAEIVPAANALAKLPGVLDVTVAAGRAFASSTQPSDRSVVFVMTFKPGAASTAATDWARSLADVGYGDRVSDVTVYAGVLQNYLVSQQFTDETTTAALQRRAAALEQQKNLRQQAK